MAECPGGRTTRGTRSQFRLGSTGLGQYTGFYPIHLGDIMDAVPLPQTDLLSSRNPNSPGRGTRTLTVREYEQTISELKKDNFDVKLRLYLLENGLKKNCKDNIDPTEQDPIEVIVRLSSETQSLEKELQYKDKLLQDALELAEKYKIDFKGYEKKCFDLQSELSSLSELPSKKELVSLINEKDSYFKHIQFLEKELTEKEQEINEANQKIEILAEQNGILEEKIQKRSLAVQGFIQKNLREKEMFPEELRKVVISATQAAKNGKKDDVILATENFSAILHKIMYSVDMNKSEEKENMKSPRTKCLKERFLENSSVFLPSQNESCTESSSSKNLKYLSERNACETKKLDHFDSFIQEPFVQGKVCVESSVNIAERDIVDNLHFSTLPSTTEENLISFSTRCSSQPCTVDDDNVVSVKTMTTSPDFILEQETAFKSVETSAFGGCLEESCQLKKVLIENEKLKLELTEKLALIKDLQAACEELELKVVQVKKVENDALKASKQHSVNTQTNVTGCYLLDEMSKLQNDAKLSNNIDELREDILLLLLTVEDKNKELSDVKQSLLAVQEELKNVQNTSNSIDKNNYMNEISELHERLAFSCSVNDELMRHLKNLEAFMEDLLQNKFDSSMENMSEKSSFFNYLSKCLSESLRMSNVLSDHLSICEGSKLFEECDSFVYKNGSYFDDKSLPHLNLSQLNGLEQPSLSYPGNQFHGVHVPFVRKGDQRVNKVFNVSQPCWQSWQQPNLPLNKLEMAHQGQSSIVPKNMNYPSSESDIWSEPDRDVSMQRIGISLQNSPVASKSPRKLRGKEKQLSNRLSSEQDTSSTDSQRLSKKRNGSISRRLFSKDNIKNQDFTSEKFYFLLTEKYSKLKALLDEFESIVGGKASDEIWIKLNTVLASLGEALQKLHIARDSAKDFPSAVCGRCVMLELLAELKISYKEADFYVENSSMEQDILLQFSREINLLKEACKEPFSFLSEITGEKSQSAQIDTSTEHIKVNELESVVVSLTKENKELSNCLDDVKVLLSKEKSLFESVKNENSKLLNQFNNLKEKLAVKQEEKDFKNEKLIEELKLVNADNAELHSILKNLEEKRKESGLELDRLTEELQKSKHDLVKMKEKCLECEKKLDHQIHETEKCENQLKILESTLLKEKEKILNEFDKLTVEKNEYIKLLETIQKEKLELEKENVIIKNNLEALSKELSGLQDTVKKLQKTKEMLNCNCTELELEIQNTKQQMASLQERYSLCEEEIVKLKEKESEYYLQLKQLKFDSFEEKKSLMNEISVLRKENNVLKEEKVEYNQQLKQLEFDSVKEKESLMKEISVLSNERDDVLKKKEAEYNQQLKQLEFDSLKEKKSLMNKISVLTKEREEVIDKLHQMNECHEKVEKEMAEIKQKYIDDCEQVSSLRLLNEELKKEQSILQQKNKFLENALHSSNSECELLSSDLKLMRGTLQNLESKCLVYEKQLADSAGMKSSLVACILNINNEILGNRRKLNEMCKTYGNENYVLWDETSDFDPVIDEQNVERLCDNLITESKKLLQSVDMLFGVLKNFHLKTVETKTSSGKSDGKLASIQNENQVLKDENKHLKLQSDKLKKAIDKLQKSMSEKEKSLQCSAYEIQSSKEKLYSIENEIAKGYQLLKEKDDEITVLQEKLFNLQTDMNIITSDKTKLSDKTCSFIQKSMDNKEDSVSSDNQLPFQPVSKSSKMCQTIDQELPYQKADDSFASTSSLETSRNSCCEKYWKKSHSLSTKLALAKKRIEILETEKNDLRESVLQQLQNNKDLGKRDSAALRLAELESKLEQKKAFINELKEDLLKTCNSLIDKDTQLDDLRQKLSKYEEKSKQFAFDMPDKHSIPLKTVDANIKTLKSYKWRLIETIFDIQRKFYEKKGIHLNYFKNFRDHVNNLYSMQVTHSISKSGSMPLLGSHARKLRFDQDDDKVKNLVGLELDIECLGNLKIFLNRFFVPSVLDNTSQAANIDMVQEEEKKIETERQKLKKEIEGLKDSKFEITDILNISFPDIFDVPLSPNHKDGVQEKSFSFEKFASNISHNLDCIEKFFTAVKQCHWLEGYDVSSQECLNKKEVKSLLLNIFEEVILHDGCDKLFELNTKLKKFDFITASPEPMSSSRPDVSDRESIMSEETIAVSRCESPFSTEDMSPLKLAPSPNILEREGKSLKPKPSGNKVAITESYGDKIAAVGSSCDSVCQRSHYSSPDLGIESDPNHDSSAPEQKDDAGISKYQRQSLEQKFINKSVQKTAFTNTESTDVWSGIKFDDTLYAVGNLPDYELLKKEVRECLVAIKSVLSRTGDGLHHIGKYTSPRKTLEYSTMKSIKDTCIHIEVCLKAAHEVVNKFWTAYCPSEEEWKCLRDKNQILTDQLESVKFMIQKQENEFKKAMGKLEHAQVVKASMEKKISKKLVKTKKLIRQAELKLLQNRCQNFPPVPKYPSDQSEQLLPSNPTQQVL